MEKHPLLKECIEPQNYAPPVCQMIIMGTQKVVCTSETEKVGETEGEW